MITNTLPTKHIRITSSEAKMLEAKCSNRLKWSDSGKWLGSGTKPNCFITDTLHNRVSHTYSFPTDSSAMKWNDMHEKGIRYTGHMATVGLSVALGLISGGYLALGAGAIVAIVKDEVQAGIPYPRMARGWSFEVVFEHTFKWSPHPWGQKAFIQKITMISRDHHGAVISQSKSEKHYQLTELPDGVARMIASSPSRSTTSLFE